MALAFHYEKRVLFPDTDMAGFVHFSNYMKYMEEAEYAFLRELGLEVVLHDERGTFGFPRVHAECQYHRATRYGDVLDIELRVLKNDGKVISYAFAIKNGETLAAEGLMRVVCCRFPTDGEPYAIPIPDMVLERIPLM